VGGAARAGPTTCLETNGSTFGGKAGGGAGLDEEVRRLKPLKRPHQLLEQGVHGPHQIRRAAEAGLEVAKKGVAEVVAYLSPLVIDGTIHRVSTATFTSPDLDNQSELKSIVEGAFAALDVPSYGVVTINVDELTHIATLSKGAGGAARGAAQPQLTHTGLESNPGPAFGGSLLRGDLRETEPTETSTRAPVGDWTPIRRATTFLPSGVDVRIPSQGVYDFLSLDPGTGKVSLSDGLGNELVLSVDALEGLRASWSAASGLEEAYLKWDSTTVPAADIQDGATLFVQNGALPGSLLDQARRRGIRVRTFGLDAIPRPPSSGGQAIYILAVRSGLESRYMPTMEGVIVVNLGFSPDRPQSLSILGALVDAARRLGGLLRVRGITHTGLEEQESLQVQIYH